MKWCALLLAAAALCLGGRAPKTFTGVIHDNRCVGPNCATQCPIAKGPVWTLEAGDDVWLLSDAPIDQKTLAKYAGRKVIVTGTVGADNKLRIASIGPAR